MEDEKDTKASDEGTGEGSEQEGLATVLEFGPSEEDGEESERSGPDSEAEDAEEASDDDPLFTNLDDEQDDQEGERDTLFDDEGEDEEAEDSGKKGEQLPFHRHPRWKEQQAKLKAAEGKVSEAQGQVKTITQERDTLQGKLEGLMAVYGKFPDPVKQVQDDDNFLRALDKLHQQGDADTLRAVRKVRETMVGMEAKAEREHVTGRKPAEEKQESKGREQEGDALNPTETRLLRQDVDSFLDDRAKVQKPFRAALRRSMLAKLGKEDLLGMADDRWREVYLEALSENELRHQDVRKTGKPGGGGGKPPSARPRAAARKGERDEERETRGEGKGRREAKGPKTSDEWSREGQDIARQAAEGRRTLTFQ